MRVAWASVSVYTSIWNEYTFFTRWTLYYVIESARKQFVIVFFSRSFVSFFVALWILCESFEYIDDGHFLFDMSFHIWHSCIRSVVYKFHGTLKNDRFSSCSWLFILLFTIFLSHCHTYKNAYTRDCKGGNECTHCESNVNFACLRRWQQHPNIHSNTHFGMCVCMCASDRLTE